MILSRLSENELRSQTDIRAYPKWWTLCLLRMLNLPTLDACLINPDRSERQVMDALRRFTQAIGREDVLVRSDGGSECKTYPRGGITYGHEEALVAIDQFLRLGRAVILLEPTNRFSNMLSLNVTIASDLSWVAEGLGCGFDTSDLQRDLVTPEWTWSGNWDHGARSEPVRARNVIGGALDTVSDQERIHQRLLSIADLLHLGEGHEGEDRARLFLLHSGNTCLFAGRRTPPSRHQVARTVNDGLAVAQYLGAEYLPFTLSYARLADRREIYWDVAVGATKWQINHNIPA